MVTTTLSDNAADPPSSKYLRSLKGFTFESGDVTIKIKKQIQVKENNRFVEKEEMCMGKVYSGAMAMASPVWKKFLFPPWATERGPVAKLDFSEDDPDALQLLLNIAHLQLTKVPKYTKPLPVPLMTALAVLCDQYDCVNLAALWLDGWLSSLAKF